MTSALLVAVFVVVGLGVTAGAIRRRFGTERSSVRDYHQTLETLRHLSESRASVEASGRASASSPSPGSNGSRAGGRSRAGGTGRGANGNAAAVDAGVSAPVAQTAGSSDAAEGGNGVRAGAGTRRGSKGRPTTLLASSGVKAGRAPVLAERSGPPAVSVPVAEPVEAAPVDPPAASPGDSAAAGPPHPHRISAADAVRELVAARNLYGPGPSRPTMPSPRGTDRSRLVWTVAAVVVIGVVIGLVLAKVPSHSPSTAASTHRSTTGAPRSAAPTARTSSGKPSTSSTGSSSTHGVTNGLDPVTSSSTAASYRVPSTPYTLTVDATGPCWVEATNSSTGQVLWTGTLHAGDSQVVPASSEVLLRLGDALNVTLAVSGQAVHLPPGFSPTIDLTFLTA